MNRSPWPRCVCARFNRGPCNQGSRHLSPKLQQARSRQACNTTLADDSSGDGSMGLHRPWHRLNHCVTVLIHSARLDRQSSPAVLARHHHPDRPQGRHRRRRRRRSGLDRPDHHQGQRQESAQAWARATSSAASPAPPPMPSPCSSGWRASSSNIPASCCAPRSNSPRTGAPTAICAGWKP